MKILMINVVCGIKSTGRICTDLATALEEQGHEVKIAYGREEVPKQFERYAVKIESDIGSKIHCVRARLFDDVGFGSKIATIKFIEWIRKYNPDVIHLHNIHGYYINIKILFEYLRDCGKRIIWTLHDCWSFTGHCTYFDYIDCNKWKEECNNCKQKMEYPKCIGFDMSKRNYKIKRKLFTGIENLTIVTPSKWLSDLVSNSYMKDYPVRVIYNGIDTEIFKPTDNDIKKKFDCENKKIILGVAAVWDKRKGFKTFIELSSLLDDKYKIILVGLTENQIKNLPSNIIGIKRTNSIVELAELYSAADVFVNPTLEDNYPTTNLEAIACGTPVITYDTGGSSESASMYGVSISRGSVDEILEVMDELETIEKRNIKVDYRDTVQEYIKLYMEM